MTKNITLRKGYFWGAATYFKSNGWEKSVAGVGIKYDLLKYDKIKIRSKYGVIEISGKKALDLVKKYNSVMIMQSTKLGIVPLSGFTKLK